MRTRGISVLTSALRASADIRRKRRALRANMLVLVAFAAETNFPFVGKLLVLTDMGWGAGWSSICRGMSP
jgi:hypothetical protein